MIVLPFLAGSFTLLAAFVVFRLWLGMLPRSICPGCGEHTALVGHPMSRPVSRWVVRRWCSACGWTGWGRNGPVLWRRRGPVADGSGFRWGEDRLQPDFGFQWKGRVLRAEKPVHPSGFRFADEAQETATDAETQTPAHPSGFRFGSRTGSAERRADHPSGFNWGDEGASTTSAHRPAFTWGDDAAEQTRREGDPSGFRWKD